MGASAILNSDAPNTHAARWAPARRLVNFRATSGHYSGDNGAMEVSHDPNERRFVHRIRPVAVAVVILAVTLWPLVRRPLVDSFPHSTYPMFSENREPVADIEVVVGVDAEGRDVTLSPELIAGTEEVIVAGSRVRTAIARGDADTRSLCLAVAERVQRSRSGDEVATIAVRTDRYDAVAWFAGDTTPLSSVEHARCDVPS